MIIFVRHALLIEILIFERPHYCLYGPITAGSDKEEDNYVPRSKILDCITSCIHVALMNDVLQQKQNMMLLLSHALSSALPWTGKLDLFYFSDLVLVLE